MRRGRRLAALRARAERGSTEGERAAARKALASEEERVEADEIAVRGPAADVEVGAVEPGVWEARDRDGRGTRYQVKVASVEIARDWFLRGAMCILVAADGRYIALDFGIVGSLTDYDKHYLAVNFLAFFNRDYKRVAELHIESGWVPPHTRVDELEGAVRTVCEPYFDQIGRAHV